MLVSLGTLVVGIPMVVLPGWLVRVITEVRTGGVFVRQWPMPFKRVELGNAASIRIADYNAWRYYDAKDILKLIRGRKLCMAADVKGRGVLIERTDGSSMLIGSRAPERLLHAIESIACEANPPPVGGGSRAMQKRFLLRISPDLWDELSRWAADDLRSVNGQIEFLLREAVRKQRRRETTATEEAPEGEGRDKAGGEDAV